MRQKVLRWYRSRTLLLQRSDHASAYRGGLRQRETAVLICTEGGGASTVHLLATELQLPVDSHAHITRIETQLHIVGIA